MNTTKKRAALIAGTLFFTAHFSLLCLYFLRPNIISVKYLYPYFHQDWQLFTPPPENNYRLYVITEKEASDVFSEIKTEHGRNRAGGWGPVLNALSNSIYYFESEAYDMKFTGGKIKNNLRFKMMEGLVQSYMAFTDKQEAGPLRLMLWVEGRDGNRRIYYN